MHGSPDEPFIYPTDRKKAIAVDTVLDSNTERSSKYEIRSMSSLAVPIALLPALEIHVAKQSVLHGTDDLQAHMVWESSIALSNWILSRRLDTEGKTILELGSGTALPSIVALLFGGARRVICTDYPDETIVEVMKKNVKLALDQVNATSDVDKEGSNGENETSNWESGINDEDSGINNEDAGINTSSSMARFASKIEVIGHKWGENCGLLLEKGHCPNGFDVLLMSDLL